MKLAAASVDIILRSQEYETKVETSARDSHVFRMNGNVVNGLGEFDLEMTLKNEDLEKFYTTGETAIRTTFDYDSFGRLEWPQSKIRLTLEVFGGPVKELRPLKRLTLMERIMGCSRRLQDGEP